MSYLHVGLYHASLFAFLLFLFFPFKIMPNQQTLTPPQLIMNIILTISEYLRHQTPPTLAALATIIIASRLLLATSYAKAAIQWIKLKYRLFSDILLSCLVLCLLSPLFWCKWSSWWEVVHQLTGGVYAFSTIDVTYHRLPLNTLIILVIFISCICIVIKSFAYRTALCGSKAGKAEQGRKVHFGIPEVLSATASTSQSGEIIIHKPAVDVYAQAQIDSLHKLLEHALLTNIQLSQLKSLPQSVVPEVSCIATPTPKPSEEDPTPFVECDCPLCADDKKNICDDVDDDSDNDINDNDVSKSARRASINSINSDCSLTADLEDHDNEILAVFTWQRQPRAKPSHATNTNLSEADLATLQQLTTVEDIQAFMKNISQQQRRPAARSMTEEEKHMSLDQLDHKWRTEDFIRRQQNNVDSLGMLTEAEKDMTVAQVKRKIRNKKQQLFFERKRADGVEVNQCTNCEEWYLGDSHHCTNTGWKLVGQNKDIPITDQFIITQRGTGDVRVRRRSGADPERVTKAYEALKEVKDKMEADEAAAQATCPPHSVPSSTTNAFTGSRLIKTEVSSTPGPELIDITGSEDDDDARMTHSVMTDVPDQAIPSMHVLSSSKSNPAKACIKSGKRKAPFRRTSQ